MNNSAQISLHPVFGIRRSELIWSMLMWAVVFGDIQLLRSICMNRSAHTSCYQRIQFTVTHCRASSVPTLRTLNESKQNECFCFCQHSECAFAPSAIRFANELTKTCIRSVCGSPYSYALAEWNAPTTNDIFARHSCMHLPLIHFNKI